jgi:hypothetical protein
MVGNIPTIYIVFCLVLTYLHKLDPKLSIDITMTSAERPRGGVVQREAALLLRQAEDGLRGPKWSLGEEMVFVIQ